MDLLALKSFSLRPLPVVNLPVVGLPLVNGIYPLLPRTTNSSDLSSTAARVIRENISSIGLTNSDRRNQLESFSLVLTPLSSKLKNLAFELLSTSSPGISHRQRLELSDVSIPLSVAVEKLNKQFIQSEIFKLDSAVGFTNLKSQILDGFSNTIFNNQTPQNLFHTPLPLSTLNHLKPKQGSQREAKSSLPTRLPYESGNQSEKAARNSFGKSNPTLSSFFEKLLRTPNRFALSNSTQQESDELSGITPLLS